MAAASHGRVKNRSRGLRAEASRKALVALYVTHDVERTRTYERTGELARGSTRV